MLREPMMDLVYLLDCARGDGVEDMRAKCEAIARDLDHFEIGKQIADAIAALKAK